MSEEKKLSTWDKILKYAPIPLILVVIGLIVDYRTNENTRDYEIETRLISTPEKRIKIEGHVDQVANDVDVFIAKQRLDSSMRNYLKSERENIERDSIRYDLVRRNTDQIYLMNQKVSHVDSVMVEILKKVQ